MKSAYQTLKTIIDEAQQLVVFTGAGISVPSGIPDFRSDNGIYQQKIKSQFSPEEIVSHTFFEKNPEEFFAFYKEKMCYPNAVSNAAHNYFADLEKKGKNVIVVTQNIDGLHQKAGSKIVYELHGDIHHNYCTKCSRLFDLNYLLKSSGVPYCNQCGAMIKPDVVLYEEALDPEIISRTISAIMTCDVLLVVGTSLKVYPAAGFIRYFKGKYLIVINKETTSFDNLCDFVFNEDIMQVIEGIKS